MASGMDLTLGEMVRAAARNNSSVLTCASLWACEDLLLRPIPCQAGLSIPAIVIALQREAELRGLAPDSATRQDEEPGMKIAITGKGGVGKTTLTSLLAYAYAERRLHRPCHRRRSVAVPGRRAGLSRGTGPHAHPHRQDGGADLRAYRRPARHHRRLLQAQPAVSTTFRTASRLCIAASGCSSWARSRWGAPAASAPSSTILRTLVTHILLRRNEVVLLDLYAGVEHLGRATADAVDALLIVVEPTARSLGTAEQIKALAGDLKLTRLYLIGSKVQNEDDRAFIRQRSPGLPVLGFLPIDPGVREADRTGVPVFDAAPALAQAARDLVASLESALRPA